ncbi:non-ribosomal peptide synthetase [Flavitalea antarctica]
METQTTRAIDLLYLAKQHGMDILLNGEQLQVKLPKNGNVDKNLLEDLKNNKQLIIDFLKEHRRKNQDSNPIVHQERLPGQPIPLSFSQERLWFIDQMEGSVQYHIPTVLRLKGKLNTHALENALYKIIERHEALRAVFMEDDGFAYQSFKNSADWKLGMINGSGYQPDSPDLQNFVQSLIRRPFDLSKDFMLRADLINLGYEDHLLVVVLHHIASDGWSISILVNEVIELYSAIQEGRPSKLHDLEIQYADYATWQRGYLQGDVLEKKLNYWKTKLQGVTALQLPTDYQRPPVWSARGATKGFSIDNELSAQLQALSQQQGTTIFMTLLAAFNVLLYRYSGQQDICVGTPIANRTQKEVEELIGFFVNTLALRSEVNGDITFTEFLQQVRTTTMEAYNYQDVPFEKVVEVVVKERDLSRSPLFQAMLVLLNTPQVHKLTLGDVQLTAEKFIQESSKFDITIYLHETPGGLTGSIEYATDLFSEDTIVRMVAHYKRLLGSVVQAPTQKIAGLVMLTEEEQNELLQDFNNTGANYPTNKTIIDVFEAQVSKTPDSVAVIFETSQLTYKALSEKSNQLAHYLQKKGVKRGDLIPVCIDRGLDMIVSILGILKAGAAYIPIDPEYPEERISYMLQDSGALTVVSSKSATLKLNNSANFSIIDPDGHWPLISQEATHNPQTMGQSQDLAYVIYTSGSTGKPKGVMIEHRSLINFLTSMQKRLQLDSNSVLLSVTTYSFDICYLEFFLPLISGANLVILPREKTMDGIKLAQSIADNRVTHMQGTPSTWQLLIDSGWQNEAALTMLVGGEPVKEGLKNQLAGMGIVFNVYGPTETTIWSTIMKLEVSQKVMIGKPLDNTTVYIVGADGQLCPINVPGEIYIGGDGLARGYLNRPELTAEKFVPHPWSKKSGARLYKTGDLGRWLKDGNLECLGRLDYQVKIRGYRIELGEIEATLNQHNDIAQAVVTVHETAADKILIAYLVLKSSNHEGEPGKAEEHSLFIQNVRGYLTKLIPAYMIPNKFYILTSIPLTANGKIDKKALPVADQDYSDHTYIAPRNHVEETLAAIWQDLLHIERIGVNDNFFELGGHSLLATRIVSAIRKKLQVEVNIKDLFKYPNINDLSEFIEWEFNLTGDFDSTSFDEVKI